MKRPRYKLTLSGLTPQEIAVIGHALYLATLTPDELARRGQPTGCWLTEDV